MTSAGKTIASRTCRKVLRPAGESIDDARRGARDAAGVELTCPVDVDITKAFAAARL
jgi:hypothetical protein